MSSSLSSPSSSETSSSNPRRRPQHARHMASDPLEALFSRAATTTTTTTATTAAHPVSWANVPPVVKSALDRLAGDVEDLRRENALLRRRLATSEKRHEELLAEVRNQRALIPTPHALGEEANRATAAIAVQLQRQSAENQELVRLLRKAKHNFEAAVGEVRDNTARFERRWGAELEAAVASATETKIRQVMRPEELQGALTRLREAMEASARLAATQRESEGMLKFLAARVEALEKRSYNAHHHSASSVRGGGGANGRHSSETEVDFLRPDPLAAERRARIDNAVSSLRKMSSSSSAGV